MAQGGKKKIALKKKEFSLGTGGRDGMGIRGTLRGPRGPKKYCFANGG